MPKDRTGDRRQQPLRLGLGLGLGRLLGLGLGLRLGLEQLLGLGLEQLLGLGLEQLLGLRRGLGLGLGLGHTAGLGVRLGWLAAALVLASGLGPGRLVAQTPSSFQPDTGAVIATAPHWVGEFAVLSGNAVVSGLTAGVVRKIRGGSFREGFLSGLLGGGVVYGGKRIAAQRFDGAGLLGREVASVGGSMVRNAGDGVGLLDRVVLPVGLARVYVDRRSPRSSTIRLDAVATAWTLYAISERELTFDRGASLSAGAPVFKTHNKVMAQGDERAGGYSRAGVVLLSDVPAWGPVYAERALHHELEHMLQEDQIFGTWLRPAQAALLKRVPGGGAFDRWVDLDFSTEVLDGLSRLVPQHDVRPWEIEADYLAKRR